MSTTVIPHEPSKEEMNDFLAELMQRTRSVQKRGKLSDESFREFVFDAMRDIGKSMGLILESVIVILGDMGYSFVEGFKEGVAEARSKSIKNRR